MAKGHAIYLWPFFAIRITNQSIVHEWPAHHYISKTCGKHWATRELHVILCFAETLHPTPKETTCRGGNVDPVAVCFRACMTSVRHARLQSLRHLQHEVIPTPLHRQNRRHVYTEGVRCLHSTTGFPLQNPLDASIWGLDATMVGGE